MIVARELTHIDITHRPDVLQIVETARLANEPIVLRRESEDVAILRPVKQPARRRPRKGSPTSVDDPLWDIVGMARSEGPGDVAENVDKYLAEAHLANQR